MALAQAATLPVTESLKTKAQNNPNSNISVQMLIGDNITGAARTTLIEDVKGMTKSFSKAGNLINFLIKGKRLQDLPMPEGVRYDVPARACTQVVMKMVNPETGETRTATDGCQVSNLKEAGWVPASGGDPVIGKPDNGGNSGIPTAEEARQARLTRNAAVFAVGAAIISGLAWAGSS